MTVQINGTTGVTTPGLTTDTSVANTSSTLTGEPVTRIKTYTAQATTSGTSIDFTGIPSWAKRITLILSNVSTNGSAITNVQLGTSGGIATSGYVGSYVGVNTNPSSNSFGALTGTGFASSGNSGPVAVRHGVISFTLLNNNLWVQQGITSTSDVASATMVSGSIQLSGTLDRLRLSTSNGTDSYDSGSANILVEG